MNPNDPDRVWTLLPMDLKAKALSCLTTQELAQATLVDHATHHMVGTRPVAGVVLAQDMSRHNDAYEAAVLQAEHDLAAQWQVTARMGELVRIIRGVPDMVTNLSADWSSHPHLLEQYNRFETITVGARRVMPEGVIPADPFEEITF